MSPLVKVLVAAVLVSLGLNHVSAASDVSASDTKEAFQAFVEKVIRGEIQLTRETFPQGAYVMSPLLIILASPYLAFIALRQFTEVQPAPSKTQSSSGQLNQEH